MMRACPICKKQFETTAKSATSVTASSPATFPFCSERCRLIDLGKWLGGDYAVPATDITDESLLDELQAAVEAAQANEES